MNDKLICIKDEDDPKLIDLLSVEDNSNLCCWHLLLGTFKKIFKSIAP